MVVRIAFELLWVSVVRDVHVGCFEGHWCSLKRWLNLLSENFMSGIALKMRAITGLKDVKVI